MIISPKVRGFICTTAHPEGCAKHVDEQIAYIKQQSPLSKGPKHVLIIGASTGYGLATRIAATFGANAKTIGVFFERPAEGKRTASAGWYNTAQFEKRAHEEGHYAKSINGDAFSDAIKQQTIDLIQKDWNGQVDCVIYSLASPRRQDPKTGVVYSSQLKPIGQVYDNKTVDVMTGDVSNIHIDPANEDDVAQTIKVMGGEDWILWMEALKNANVLANGCQTIAYSYIGPALTYPIYREGTIGKAKEDLENTASVITEQLKALDGHAYVSVNKALVTQASSAIPVVPLYISLLYKLMKANNTHEGCIEQMWRLFAERLYSSEAIALDDEGRIRLDDWELSDDIQSHITPLWEQVSTENLESISDIATYRKDFYKLFGFGLEGVDYDKDVDPNVTIPSIAATETV